MIIICRANATDADIHAIVEKIEGESLRPHVSRGSERTVIGIVGDERLIRREMFLLMPGVENVIPVLRPYKLASREFHPGGTIVKAGGVEIGGENLVIIAGPCSVENAEQIQTAAASVKAAGASLLRGGAFKPRTSPYAFQGLGEEGLKLLADARDKTGLGIVTEVLESADVGMVAEYADMLQVGARNMNNTQLLRALAGAGKPVLLKRNFSATMTEFLMAAEYLLSGGNPDVVLCERGIRTFVEYSRNTLDLNVVPAVKSASHLPIIVDPSHGTGRLDLVLPMSRAAIAAGADGLLVEVHPRPAEALSDGEQSLTPDAFRELVRETSKIAGALNRSLLPR